jgi:hypothetical protein
MASNSKVTGIVSLLVVTTLLSVERPLITTQYSDQDLLSLSKEAIIQEHLHLYADYLIEGEDLPLERLVEGDLQPILKRKRELEKLQKNFPNGLNPNLLDEFDDPDFIPTDDRLPVTRNVTRSVSDTLQYFPSDGAWDPYFFMLPRDAMMVMYQVQASGTLKGVNVPVYMWGQGDQELTISLHRVSYPNRSDGSTYNANDGIVNGNGWIGGYDMDESTGYMEIEGTSYSSGGTQGVCYTGVNVADNAQDPLGTEDGTALDDINLLTNPGFEDGFTRGWKSWPHDGSQALISTGETMDNSTDTFTAAEGDYAVKLWGLSSGESNMENNVYKEFNYGEFAPGTSFDISAQFYHHNADPISNSYGVLFAKYFSDDSYTWIGMDTVRYHGSNAADTWHQLTKTCTVPENTAIVQIGVMHVQPSDADGGSIYVDDFIMMGQRVPVKGLVWPSGSNTVRIDPTTQADYTGNYQSAGGNVDNWIALADYGSEVEVTEDEWIGILVQYTGAGDVYGDFGGVGFWAESNNDIANDPYVFTKFYNECEGTSGNGGWHIRSWLINYQLAIEYDNNPPPIHVSGDVYGNWSADTVFVDGNIHIPQHMSLTIQEGVTVYFNGYQHFEIYGDLYVSGSETDSVKFTSESGNLHNIDSWSGLRFYSTHHEDGAQVSNINYAIIENADNGIYYYGTWNGDGSAEADSNHYWNHSISNSLIQYNRGDGIGSDNYFTNLTIDNCTVTRNGWWNYGVGVWIGWDAENVSLTNSTITHNGYEDEGSNYNYGIRTHRGAYNILVDNNIIQYNQPQYYATDEGAGRGSGIYWYDAEATITNNTITYNGTDVSLEDNWQNWGIRIGHNDQYNYLPVFQNNIIHSNGRHEVYCSHWSDNWNGVELDFRNNDWGDLNSTMSDSSYHPANIDDFHDRFDGGDGLPMINYACWEGADCGYTGDLSFTNADGNAYELTVPASAETLFVHVYDLGDIGDGNEDTVTVYITSDTDSDDEAVVCVGTGNDYVGYIPIDLQSTRVMTDDYEAALLEQYVADVTSENPDWSENRVAGYAQHLLMNEYKRLYELGVRVEPENLARNDGLLQVQNGDFVVTTYYDAAGDWGTADTSSASILFGGYEGRLKGSWSAANSPYVITGYSYVAANDTLDIDQGTVIKFLDRGQIFIDGNLWAYGSVADSIKFIPYGEVDTMGHSWERIWVDYNHYETDNDQKAIFEYCEFKDAQGIDVFIDYYDEEDNPDSAVVRFNHCLITENSQSGISIWSNASSHDNTAQYSHVKVLNSSIIENLQTGIILSNNWDMPIVIKNNTIHHNGYLWEWDNWSEGILVENSNNNILIDGNDIRYNQPQYYGNGDVGQGYGIGITIGWSSAIITNNVIRDNGWPIDENWDNVGIYLRGIHSSNYPKINNNEIYDNGNFEVHVGWGDAGHEIDMRYNNWGTDATAEMESGTNPQNISIFEDWYDNNDLPFINYSCYEGNTGSCGNGGDVYFANENGSHVSEYRLWDIENDTDVDSIYIHMRDIDLENTGTVSVTLTSETDTDGETITLNETDSAGWFFGGIPFELQSSRAMTLEEEADFMEQFRQEFADQYPDKDEQDIERLAQNEVAKIRMERNLNGERVYISLNPNARDDGSLQVRSGDVVYVTYSDASNDWGTAEDNTNYVIFGGIDGELSGRWTIDNSPYVITGGVYVNNRFRIDPGVTVKFYNWTNLDVYDNASFIAIGTEQDSITLEAHALASQLGDGTNNIGNVWSGIQDYDWCCNENDRDTLLLKYVNIRDASHAVMMRYYDSNSDGEYEISNSYFADNGRAFDIYKQNSNDNFDILIKDSDISWNNRGILLEGQGINANTGEIIIDNCNITHNGHWDQWNNDNIGIEIRNESKVTIKDSRIMYNQPRFFTADVGDGRGIGIQIYHSTPTIIGNTIAENGSMNWNNDNWWNWGIVFQGIYEEYNSIKINHNNIYNNGPYDVYFDYGCCQGDSVDMANNYWGAATTHEIESVDNPQNLTRIWDWYDTDGDNRYIDYKNWRTSPVWTEFYINIGQPEAIPNDTMAVDIFLATPYDTNFISAELTFGGYSGLMDFISVDTANTLAGDNDWLVFANENTSEGLYLLMSALAGADAISGEGVLFRLNFEIPDTAVGLIPITVEEATFNSGEIDVVIENGGIDVLPLVIGDVDWNGTIQAVDGGLILKHIVGYTTLDHRSLAVADATGDESLSALDATTILDYVVGIIDSLPYDGGGYANAFAVLNYDNAFVEAGQAIDIPLTFNNLLNIHSLEGSISIESDLIRFTGLTWPEALHGYMKQLHVEDDYLRFAAAGSEIEDHNALTVMLHMDISAEFADSSNVPVLVEYVRWNEETPLVNETIQVMHISLKTDAEGLIPDVFALHQNYPNPFNPVTNIRYDIPENSHVKMVVYDILGRQVRTLVNRDHDPGFYDVLWDGRNDRGEQISSGVYFYQINAGTFHKNAKMIVVK